MIPGLGLLLLVVIGIIIFWFRFSANWEKEEQLEQFLKVNKNALVERNIPIHVQQDLMQPNFRASNWEICDLFLFPESLILRGRKNEADFHDCIFLYNQSRTKRIPKCKMSGLYNTPAIVNGILYCEITLLETGQMYFAEFPAKFDLFLSQKTISILKKNNYT